MFRHILLYLIICCLSLCRCYIHIIKFNRDINVIIRLLFQLGQKNNRLDVPWDNGVNKNAIINAVVSTHLVKNMPLNNA